MVKYLSVFFAIASIAVSVFAFPIEQRDISSVKADLQVVARTVSTLDITVTNIGSNLDISYALRINADVQAVQGAIFKCTKDVKEIPSVSEGDAKAILAQIKGFVPTILHLLNGVDAKKSAFAALPGVNVVPIIKHQLEVLRNGASELGDSMIHIAPNDVKGEAMDAKKVVDGAFLSVISHYS